VPKKFPATAVAALVAQNGTRGLRKAAMTGLRLATGFMRPTVVRSVHGHVAASKTTSGLNGMSERSKPTEPRLYGLLLFAFTAGLSPLFGG